MTWYLENVDHEMHWEMDKICVPGAPNAWNGCSGPPIPGRATVDSATRKGDPSPEQPLVRADGGPPSIGLRAWACLRGSLTPRAKAATLRRTSVADAREAEVRTESRIGE
eukprot:7618765-Pyramimonas_sp.AAC.1